MMALLLDAFAAALILVGGVIMSIAALGILRLPDVFMRMHAATKAGVVGSGLILLGAGFALESVPSVLTAMAGVLLLLATTPIASHALGRSAYLSGMPMSDALVSDALVGVYDRKSFDLAPPAVGGKR
ncbi:MAG: monovalent cation/H(+) antiporter subunit G, partial [Alphaproteobacteria bacterium]|nr:monovalent cation/H(+) antiporter subunit G [Alphaproteobacteria bacterium]